MTARAFLLRAVGMSAVVSVATTLIVSAYLLSLLSLPAEQWRGFGWIVALYFVPIFAIVTWLNDRLTGPVMRALDAEAAGTASAELRRVAFRALSGLPLRMFQQGILWWSVGGLLVSATMGWRYESFGAFPFAVMTLASTTGGFISAVFMYFLVRSLFCELLAQLAAKIPDPEERDGLVRVVSLRAKLVVAITGVTFFTVCFATLLAVVRAGEPAERNAARTIARLLQTELDPATRPAPAQLDALRRRAVGLEIARDLVVVDLAMREVVWGRTDSLLSDEIEELAARPGDSAKLRSPNVFAWQPVGEVEADRGWVVVGVAPLASVRGDLGSLLATALIVLGAAALISLGLALAIARDVGSGTGALRAAVARLAEGDLRGSAPIESDDEIGQLGRGVEGMAASLRATVGRLAQAADQVDAAAGQIDRVARQVAGGADDQAQAVREVAAAMEGVNAQARGIESTAASLDERAGESSSAALEIAAAGRQLSETAGGLSSEISGVVASIEQMIQSVAEVGGNTEVLHGAATDTSSSVEEMASTLRQVDAAAGETARLSQHVIERSEGGRSRVQETIADMEAIQSETTLVHRSISELVDRAQEIGSIVDVIDDVADETSLLALNAAVIAAQAGDEGRAFSVVAGEVKQLANRVLTSTKEIAALIGAVQKQSREAAAATESSARRVSVGLERSRDAGAALQEIAESSRESGARIQEIVRSVGEQSRAAAHVVQLMVNVGEGAGSIQRAMEEQTRGGQHVRRGVTSMRELAEQLHATTGEQMRGTHGIGEGAESVREAVGEIANGLREQAESCSQVASSLDQVAQGAHDHRGSSEALRSATRDLLQQAEALREDVERFRL